MNLQNNPFFTLGFLLYIFIKLLSFWDPCGLPSHNLPKMEFLTDHTFLKNWVICRLTICRKFMTCAICQNVVLTTLPSFSRRAMTDSTEIKGQAKVCARSEHRATHWPRGRRHFLPFMMFLANREFFVRSVKNSIRQIALRQIAMHLSF